MTDLERVQAQANVQVATCAGCGNEFDQPIITLAGRPLAMQRRCESCRELEEQRAGDARVRWNLDRSTQEGEKRAAEYLARCRRAIEMLNVPELYAGAAFDRWELHGPPAEQNIQQRVVTAGLRYLAEWPMPAHWTLILRGGTGTGKGHWVWSIARELADGGEFVRVVKLADMVRRLRRSWRGQSDESEEEALDLYRQPDLLVVDEVSRHAFYGEQIHQHLYDVLDYRIERMRPTLLTSNETNEGLAAILRDALLSRIHGTGGVLEFGSADFRLHQRAARTAAYH